ncbi:MAG TPA: hypothetical protein VF808_20355 [Ktedonobacterales bacterium]
MTRLVMRLLRTRWGLFVCAIASLAIGLLALLLTTAPHFVRIDGTVASYAVVNNAAGSYDHNELRLSGDPTVYKLDDSEYTPAPPDTLATGAQVSIWVDQGHPWILAISVPDASGAGARRYTTFVYDHPDQNLLIGRIAGGVFILLFVVLAGMGLSYDRLPWRYGRRKPAYTPTYLAPGMYDQDQRRP